MNQYEYQLTRYVVDKETGCWNWSGCTNSKHYGQVRRNGRKVGAHRVFYEHHVGKVPKGFLILHRCDNPKCVNPEHLFLGTAKDNMDDMFDKGRENKLHGEQHARSKLTNDQVLAIRKDTRAQWQIAIDYKVSQITVSSIKRLATWKHLIGEPL